MTTPSSVGSNRTKLYVWHLAVFLAQHRTRMSGAELAQHLNRNRFRTSYGAPYRGKRGTYKLVRETWRWLHTDLELPTEATAVAKAFVTPSGRYAYKVR